MKGKDGEITRGTLDINGEVFKRRIKTLVKVLIGGMDKG